ncbi:hypothetical protein DMUE_5984, partial [Dictyocoela muelleri]
QNENNMQNEDGSEVAENIAGDHKRKTRRKIPRDMIECFFGLLQRDVSLIEMSNILNLSYKTAKRLYKKYLNGEFQDLSSFKSAAEKKKATKKDFSYEKIIIASEIVANPCINLKSICEKLALYSGQATYSSSPSTVCRIIRGMDFKKKMTLVQSTEIPMQIKK